MHVFLTNGASYSMLLWSDYGQKQGGTLLLLLINQLLDWRKRRHNAGYSPLCCHDTAPEKGQRTCKIDSGSVSGRKCTGGSREACR